MKLEVDTWPQGGADVLGMMDGLLSLTVYLVLSI